MFKSFMKICTAFIMALTMILLSACSGEEPISPAEITEKIMSEITITEPNSLSGDKLSAYFQFKDTDVKRFSVLISGSTDSADTLAAFEVVNEEKQNLVITGIAEYLTKLSSAMKHSVESEYIKVQSRLLMKTENTIILVICSEPDKALRLLEDIGAKAVY